MLLAESLAGYAEKFPDVDVHIRMVKGSPTHRAPLPWFEVPGHASRRNCACRSRNLLVDGVVGRVARATPVGPRIVPVNYLVHEDAIVVRTAPYSRLNGPSPFS